MRNSPEAYQKGNVWMCRHASRIIAVWDCLPSGTQNTIDYAKEIGLAVNIIEVQKWKENSPYWFWCWSFQSWSLVPSSFPRTRTAVPSVIWRLATHRIWSTWIQVRQGSSRCITSIRFAQLNWTAGSKAAPSALLRWQASRAIVIQQTGKCISLFRKSRRPTRQQTSVKPAGNWSSPSSKMGISLQIAMIAQFQQCILFPFKLLLVFVTMKYLVWIMLPEQQKWLWEECITHDTISFARSKTLNTN